MKRKILSIILISAMALNLLSSLSVFASGVKYDAKYYQEVLTDDFSGDLSKWSANEEHYVLQDNDTLRMYAHGSVLEPKMDPAKAMVLEFDATGWQVNGLSLYFTDHSDDDFGIKEFALIIPNGDLEGALSFGIMEPTTGSPAKFGSFVYRGGTIEQPKTNRIKIVLENGTLYFYVKYEGTDEFVAYSFEQTDTNVDKLINPNGEYTVRFYQVNNGSNYPDAAPVYIDNVSIKTIPTVYAKEEYTFEENFDSADWANDWTTDPAEHTWDGNTMVTFADSLSYPTGISGSQLTAKLTLDTTNAGKLNNGNNYILAVQFQNVDDPNNFLVLGFADNNGIYSFYNGQAYWQANWQFSDINNIKFNDSDKKKSTETYIFELTDSALTITEEGSGDQTIFEDKVIDNGDGTTTTVTNFSTYFKPDATYKVGIYSASTSAGDFTKVDKFTVDVTEPKLSKDKTADVGVSTFEETFADVAWYSDWTGATDSLGQAEATYDAEKGVIYPTSSMRSMIADGIADDELTVELTVGGGAAVTDENRVIGVYFANASNFNDYVVFWFRPVDDGKLALMSDNNTGGTRAINDVRLNSSNTEGTYTFKLTSDGFTAKQDNGTEFALDSELYSTNFTQDATYRVGLYVSGCADNNTLYVDNFKVTTPPANVISTQLQAEIAADTYKDTTNVEAGVNYKLTLKSQQELTGKYLAAVYDGDKFVNATTIDAVGEAEEILVPYSAQNPSIKVFVLSDIINMQPICAAFDY